MPNGNDNPASGIPNSGQQKAPIDRGAAPNQTLASAPNTPVGNVVDQGSFPDSGRESVGKQGKVDSNGM